MYGNNNSARSARAAQRGENREQLEQDEVEVMEDPDLITVQNVQGQDVPSSPTVGGQLKVMVHNPEEADEMPAVEYTAAVARLIAVSNTEVKNMARKIAQARRKMESAMDGMWDIIKSADKSTNPAVKERIKGIEERLAKVELAGDLLHQIIEETVDAVNAHLEDQEQIDMEATLMRMLTQTIQHTRRARQEGLECQDRLEKFEKNNSITIHCSSTSKELGIEFKQLEQHVEGGPVLETHSAKQGRHSLRLQKLPAGLHDLHKVGGDSHSQGYYSADTWADEDMH